MDYLLKKTLALFPLTIVALTLSACLKGLLTFNKKNFILLLSALEGSETCPSDESNYRTDIVTEECLNHSGSAVVCFRLNPCDQECTGASLFVHG